MSISRDSEYIASLEKQVASKQLELQHLVGSKYHDFIDSADSISRMLDSAVIVESKIPNLWKLKLSPIILESKKVVDNQIATSWMTTTNKPLHVEAKCNSRSLWDCIGRRDVPQAAMVRYHDVH